MKPFGMKLRKSDEGNTIGLTLFVHFGKRKEVQPERALSFAELIGFDKAGGYFQKATMPTAKS